MNSNEMKLADVIKEQYERCGDNELSAKDFLFNYSHTSYPVSDYVSEQADNNVGIYYSELKDWLKTNYYSVEYMERVVNDGLVSIGSDYDFFKHIQTAQYLQEEESLYDGLTEDSWLLFILCFAEQELSIETLTEEQLETLKDIAGECSSDTCMDSLIDLINEVFDVEE